jgi:hypothetical protein
MLLMALKYDWPTSVLIAGETSDRLLTQINISLRYSS